MKLYLLNEADLIYIYDHHMVNDFPEEERKPLSLLLRCMRDGTMLFYGAFEYGEPAGYIFIMRDNKTGMLLIDYLAVISGKRGSGCGSRMLKALALTLPDSPGALFEYEWPDDTREDSVERRRERFYLRGGVRRTGLDLTLYGVRYAIGYLPIANELTDADIKRIQTGMYNDFGYTRFEFTDNI